jgi:dephospho-CoA kinase
MTVEKFEAILARQTPDAQKREMADFIVSTDDSLDAARAQVGQIVSRIKAGDWQPKNRDPD